MEDLTARSARACPAADPSVDPAADPFGADDQEVLAGALRDFFMARNAAEMARALKGLGWPAPQGGEPPLEVEYAFNRLFVGPGPLAAPPYSSVYLDPDSLLMGQSCLEVRALIRDLGLGFVRQGGEPDDHLARELDLWLFLHRLIRVLKKRGDSTGLRQEIEAARDWLVEEHMALWLPRFQARARGAGELPCSLRFSLARLEHWLNVCSQRRSDGQQ